MAYSGIRAAQKGQLPSTRNLPILRAEIAAGRGTAEDLCHVGWYYMERNQFRLARSCFLRAIALNPHPAIKCDLANCLRLEERLDEANALYEVLAKEAPSDADVLYGTGLLRYDEGKFDEAIALYEASHAVEPDNPWPLWDRALSFLSKGDWTTGFSEYDVRFEVRLQHFLKMPMPMWRGEPLDDKTLWVVAEQGLGDTLHFWRWLDKLPDFKKVHVHVQPELMRLLSNQPRRRGIIIEPIGTINPSTDYFVPLLSLAHRTGPCRPRGFPYIRSVLEPVVKIPQEGLRVGICWETNRVQFRQALRKLSPEVLLEFADLPGVKLYSLQVPTDKLIDTGVDMVVPNVGLYFRDLADTASIIDQLDMVISIDSSVAHLAAAMGKETWLLLPFVSCWRWGREGTTTPWYDSMRLFREPAIGQHDKVIEEVAKALYEKALAK